jgi:tetratricopeptide (TPR) repeat protein
VSETKETEAGAEAQSEGLDESVKDEGAEPAESAESERPVGEAEAEAAGAEPSPTPKKKKKKARLEAEAEPETIKDRNARVRAEAAEKRRSRREREQGGPSRRNLDASEVMDDALARSTHAAAGFLKQHFNKVQWAVMLGLVGWIGWEVYSWRADRTAEKSTALLFKALAAETGRVGDDAAEKDERTGLSDNRRAFPNDEARLKAAKGEYQTASASVSGISAVLADLGAAGVAYDLGQYKDAQAAYEKVKLSAAFGRDPDIKGRTLEGLGMALEAQKNDEGALRAFKDLSNMDSANFAALGLYHQARILKSQGKNEDAIKLLEKAGEKLVTLKDNQGAIRYLRVSVLELYETLDSTKARELGEKLTPAEMKLGGGAPGSGAGQKLSPEKIQELIEEMKRRSPPAPAQDAAPAPGPGPLKPPEDAPAPAPSGAP